MQWNLIFSWYGKAIINNQVTLCGGGNAARWEADVHVHRKNQLRVYPPEPKFDHCLTPSWSTQAPDRCLLIQCAATSCMVSSRNVWGTSRDILRLLYSHESHYFFPPCIQSILLALQLFGFFVSMLLCLTLQETGLEFVILYTYTFGKHLEIWQYVN